MSTLRCRRAREDDASDLVALRYEWRTREAGERGLSEGEFARHMADWMRQHAKSHLGFLATRDAEAVGCAWLCVVDRVPGPGQLVRRGGLIQSVYVRGSERNVGVGSELMRLIVAEAREMELSYLIVHPSERALTFYQRLGFAPYERALELRF
ncbi:MAG TPA: GNAT family N-acetyltransferase [Acidimicrobiales bacterium]